MDHCKHRDEKVWCLVIAPTDSEAPTLVTSNVDPFIIDSANGSARPLVEVMDKAVVVCRAHDALQAIEDDRLARARFKLYSEVLADP